MKLKTKNLSVILVVATFYSLIAQMVKNLPAMQVIRVQSLGQEDTLEKGMATHSSILAWRSHGQRSLVGYSPWGCKESSMTEQLTLSLFTSHSLTLAARGSLNSSSLCPESWMLLYVHCSPFHPLIYLKNI